MASQACRTLCALAALLLAACESSGVGSEGAPDTGPALTADKAQMGAALHCPERFTSAHNPVLLVHGTGADADVTWNSGLVRVLEQRGYDACTVNLPQHSWGDIQTAAEFVVNAVEVMAQRSGRQVSVVAHSQGALQVNWAIKWWPGVQALVDDSIGLAGIYHGVHLANNICAAHACPPSGWQMDVGSRFIAALSRGDETPGHIDYSSIYSEADGTATYPGVALEGGRTIAVQEICPGRETGHSDLVVDAVSVALLLDAIGHDGPADPDRIDRRLCDQDMAEGIDPQEVNGTVLYGGLIYAATLLEAGLVFSEPALRDYVVE